MLDEVDENSCHWWQHERHRLRQYHIAVGLDTGQADTGASLPLPALDLENARTNDFRRESAFVEAQADNPRPDWTVEAEDWL